MGRDDYGIESELSAYDPEFVEEEHEETITV